MKKKNQTILINRTKSLAWRIGMMSLAFIIAFVADNIGLFDLNVEVTSIIGLVLGEISKVIDTKIKE